MTSKFIRIIDIRNDIHIIALDQIKTILTERDVNTGQFEHHIILGDRHTIEIDNDMHCMLLRHLEMVHGIADL